MISSLSWPEQPGVKWWCHLLKWRRMVFGGKCECCCRQASGDAEEEITCSSLEFRGKIGATNISSGNPATGGGDYLRRKWSRRDMF